MAFAIRITSLRNWIYTLLSLIFGLGAGVLSAYYAIYQDFLKPVTVTGSWHTSREIRLDEWNPYAIANTARYGGLKLTSNNALYFIAKKDSENRDLSGSCEYALAGDGLDAKWWSVTVYNTDGSLIENPAERYSFNSTNLLRARSGGFNITIAANARPGNWIPLKQDADFTIVLRLYLPGERSYLATNENGLPKIERGACS